MVGVFVAEQKGIEPDFVRGDRSQGETAEFSFVEAFGEVAEVGVDTDNLPVGELEDKAGAAEPVDDDFARGRDVVSDVFKVCGYSRLLALKKTGQVITFVGPPTLNNQDIASFSAPGNLIDQISIVNQNNK